ncbi:MAG: STAS domain-containing protein, partial [Clostridium sp.]
MTEIKTEAKIDIAGAPVLEEQLKQFLKNGERDLIIDMSETNYISSVGLRVFASIQKKINAMGGSMVLTNVTSRVLDVFEVTGFTGILTIEEG